MPVVPVAAERNLARLTEHDIAGAGTRSRSGVCAYGMIAGGSLIPRSLLWGCAGGGAQLQGAVPYDLAAAKAVGDYAAAVRARKIRGLLVACLSDHYRQVLGPVLTFRKRAAVYGCPGMYCGSSLVIFHTAHFCVLATRNELLLGS